MLFKRSGIYIYADAKKVILKYLNLGVLASSTRIQPLVDRILALDEEQVVQLYQEVEKDFKHRHLNFEYYL